MLARAVPVPLIEVESLACAAGDRCLFERLGLRVAPGQWALVSGPNGSGKSTLLRALAGLVRPLAGSVRIGAAGSSPTGAAAVLYLGHRPGFTDALPVRRNLAFQLALDLGTEPAAAHIDALLARVGLASSGELSFGELSAGQRRRLALARLAAAASPVWLLDEPDEGLDAQGRTLLAGLLRERLALGGCAVVASHRRLLEEPAPATIALGEAPADA